VVTARHDLLRTMLEEIYRAVGVPADEAEIVARHQVTANLVGHDSHGVIQTPVYVKRLKDGQIVPGAAFEVERSTATTAVVDANWGFGFVQTERATQLAIDMARDAGIGAVTIRYQGHIGRLGAYTKMAAEAGMIALIVADSGRAPKAVAPFGGRGRRLGTNPLSVGIPRASGHPIILDMATSAVAAGKIALARDRGEAIPEGWVIDADGNPTTDPNAYYRGGALLPLGAEQGYKGFGLSVVVEVLCGVLTGLGFGVYPEGQHNDGCFLIVFEVSHFRDPGAFTAEVDDFVEYLRGTPPAAGSSGVVYPGELEERTSVERERDGIEIEPATWQALLHLLDDLGLQVAGANAPEALD
jgi:LDH2 family malate/lactate/ureidoglycolate dehydrogenase